MRSEAGPGRRGLQCGIHSQTDGPREQQQSHPASKPAALACYTLRATGCSGGVSTMQSRLGCLTANADNSPRRQHSQLPAVKINSLPRGHSTLVLSLAFCASRSFSSRGSYPSSSQSRPLTPASWVHQDGRLLDTILSF